MRRAARRRLRPARGPAVEAANAALEKVESGIRASGGFAMRVGLHLKSEEQLAQQRGLFDRGAEYATLLDQIKGTRASLRRLGPRKSKTGLDPLQRQADRIAAIDFYPGAEKSRVADSLSSLQRDCKGMHARGEPRISRRQLRPSDLKTYQARTWATRKDPWVDRLASAWLIKRFIDPAARFAWLDRPSSLPPKAVGYDFDGTEFTHVGNRVTFEVLMETFGLDGDPALAEIGASVHYLDIGGNSAADAKGLETVLKGVKEKAENDDALLAEAMRIFYHFHSSYRASARSRKSSRS